MFITTHSVPGSGKAVLNGTFMQRTELYHYYGCTTMQTFDFRDTNGSMEITMRVQNLQVQAFNFSNTTGVFDVHSCKCLCMTVHVPRARDDNVNPQTMGWRQPMTWGNQWPGYKARRGLAHLALIAWIPDWRGLALVA